MHKNFYEVVQGTDHNYTLRPADLASIPKSMQNTNSRDLKKTNEQNSTQRRRITRNRTSFNEVQNDSIFLNNQKYKVELYYTSLFYHGHGTMIRIPASTYNMTIVQ